MRHFKTLDRYSTSQCDDVELLACATDVSSWFTVSKYDSGGAEGAEWESDKPGNFKSC